MENSSRIYHGIQGSRTCRISRETQESRTCRISLWIHESRMYRIRTNRISRDRELPKMHMQPRW